MLRATVLASELTAEADTDELETVPVDFDHPLWILFSSGTTGLPKGIMHGHGGVVLEHLKAIALQSDIGADDTFFWYTSPSWMMWNFQVAGLLVGATIVCYDGSPNHPKPDALWDIAARVGATVLGTSPGYVLGCAKAGAVPRTEHDLSALRTVGITGSSLPPSSSLWLRDNVGERVQVASISGGTDVVSAFIGGVRTVPVWPGELSAPYLGVALDAWDESGKSVRGEVGELVITKPMPSMPVAFWNDADGSRYRSAYFEMFPGVWRHGDWITITGHGSIVVHGRSDSTLNRHGIRMGSADIYQAVERLPEIAEALVIGAEQPDGGYWMPLFVVLADDAELTDALRDRIKATSDPRCRRGMCPTRSSSPRCSAHPHGQEARGADQEDVPRRRPRPGRGEQRGRQPRASGLVRQAEALAAKVFARGVIDFRMVLTIINRTENVDDEVMPALDAAFARNVERGG